MEEEEEEEERAKGERGERFGVARRRPFFVRTRLTRSLSLSLSLSLSPRGPRSSPAKPPPLAVSP
jgi:hypothetical protein